jgi:hypothetical protein
MTALYEVEGQKVHELVRNRWEWSQMRFIVVGSYEDVVSAVRGPRRKWERFAGIPRLDDVRK